MSSIHRRLDGGALLLDLGSERREAIASMAPAGRIARTLIKGDLLRVTMVVLAPGGGIPEHQADGAITVQPLEGAIRFSALGEVHELQAGQLLSLAPGVRHSVTSPDGATFLLTVAVGREVP
ncbi:MAG: cupin domain-containing protein [Gemmatimonadales bacterium]